MIRIGYAKLKGNKLYFDSVGWAMIKEAARKKKKSPRSVVVAALKRLVRSQNGEKS
jgi:hypothetical protein